MKQASCGVVLVVRPLGGQRLEQGPGGRSMKREGSRGHRTNQTASGAPAPCAEVWVQSLNMQSSRTGSESVEKWRGAAWSSAWPEGLARSSSPADTSGRRVGLTSGSEWPGTAIETVLPK